MFRRLGEAVARQVGEHQPFAQDEEVELLRAARRIRGARQVVLSGQRVEQAGFADVRPSGEGDLGQVGFGDLVEPGDAEQEGACLREQPAAVRQRLFPFGIGIGTVGFFGVHISPLRSPLSGCGRCAALSAPRPAS